MNMNNPIDKEKELREMNESQASLVNALESIHTLLEESETKLSAARESLAGSRIDNQKHYRPSLGKVYAKPPSASLLINELTAELDSDNTDEDELAVPILEDIVIAGSKAASPSLFGEIENSLEAVASEISDARKQEFIDRVEGIQIEMDDYLNEMLVRCMAGIELDIKETLSNKLQELRDIIEKP